MFSDSWFTAWLQQVNVFCSKYADCNLTTSGSAGQQSPPRGLCQGFIDSLLNFFNKSFFCNCWTKCLAPIIFYTHHIFTYIHVLPDHSQFALSRRRLFLCFGLSCQYRRNFEYSTPEILKRERCLMFLSSQWIWLWNLLTWAHSLLNFNELMVRVLRVCVLVCGF